MIVGIGCPINSECKLADHGVTHGPILVLLKGMTKSSFFIGDGLGLYNLEVYNGTPYRIVVWCRISISCPHARIEPYKSKVGSSKPMTYIWVSFVWVSGTQCIKTSLRIHSVGCNRRGKYAKS